MPVPIRIVLVVIGFVLLIGAEFAQRASDRTSVRPGVTRMQTLDADARVLGLRLGGALLILIGLLSFVLANHLPHTTSLRLS
jgi:hypothetical protein